LDLIDAYCSQVLSFRMEKPRSRVLIGWRVDGVGFGVLVDTELPLELARLPAEVDLCLVSASTWSSVRPSCKWVALLLLSKISTNFEDVMFDRSEVYSSSYRLKDTLLVLQW